MAIIQSFLDTLAQLAQESGFAGFFADGGWKNIIMILISFVFMYLAVGRGFEPLLLLPISFGMLLTNLPGAIAGVVCGGATVFIWKFGIAKLGGLFAIYELLPAFIVSSIAIIVVSLLTAPPSEEIVRTFDEVKVLDQEARREKLD